MQAPDVREPPSSRQNSRRAFEIHQYRRHRPGLQILQHHPQEGAMQCANIDENAPAISAGNVIDLAPHQRRARRRRHWAWWRALLFGFAPAKAPQTVRMSVASSGAVVKFRRQAGGAG
jgi:hypothetical protein